MRHSRTFLQSIINEAWYGPPRSRVQPQHYFRKVQDYGTWLATSGSPKQWSTLDYINLADFEKDLKRMVPCIHGEATQLHPYFGFCKNSDIVRRKPSQSERFGRTLRYLLAKTTTVPGQCSISVQFATRNDVSCLTSVYGAVASIGLRSSSTISIADRLPSCFSSGLIARTSYFTVQGYATPTRR